MSLNQTRAQKIRGALLSIAQNESVFLFVAFVSYSFLSTDVLAWYVDSIAAFNRFVVLPWGGALCLLRLCRAQERKLEPHADIRFLVLLYAWIVVPFGIRFGLTAINANDWFHCMVAFFGVYALITEETVQRREMLLDVAGALFAALSFVWRAAALLRVHRTDVRHGSFPKRHFRRLRKQCISSPPVFNYNTTAVRRVLHPDEPAGRGAAQASAGQTGAPDSLPDDGGGRCAFPEPNRALFDAGRMGGRLLRRGCGKHGDSQKESAPAGCCRGGRRGARRRLYGRGGDDGFGYPPLRVGFERQEGSVGFCVGCRGRSAAAG